MEEKIRQYVNYQFRFDKREGLEDLKEEIIGNLVDRYHALLSEGKSEEEAYVESIKSMGDFSEHSYNKVSEEYKFKPSIADVTLVVSSILAIFGLILTLLSSVPGTLITAASILSFGGAAYYLYSYSQYIRKEEMDIEKHHLLLHKIFKYVKTNFIFWALSLSLIFTRIVSGLINTLYILSIDEFTELLRMRFHIMVTLVVFTLVLLIFILIFMYIYKLIMRKYYLLTGEVSLKGNIAEGVEFLQEERLKFDFKGIYTRYILPSLVLVLLILVMLVPAARISEKVVGTYHTNVVYEGLSLFSLLIRLVGRDLSKWFELVLIFGCGIAIVVTVLFMYLDRIKKHWPIMSIFFIMNLLIIFCSYIKTYEEYQYGQIITSTYDYYGVPELSQVILIIIAIYGVISLIVKLATRKKIKGIE